MRENVGVPQLSIVLFVRQSVQQCQTLYRGTDGRDCRTQFGYVVASSTRRVADVVVVVDGFAWGDLFDRMRKISKKRRVSNTEMFVINYFFIGRT